MRYHYSVWAIFHFNKEEFAANVYWALHHDPQPLSVELRYTLSWEAATERYLYAYYCYS